MKIINRQKYIKFRQYSRNWQFKSKPNKVILHHTVSPKVGGTERYLATTPYGYHYMIGKDGKIYNYVDPGKMACNHAKWNNRGTIGVSFVCGGKYGAVNELQISSAVSLLKYLKNKYPSVTLVTGHKDVSPKRKIDPRWPGEPANGVNRAIHVKYMRRIEKETGLKYK